MIRLFIEDITFVNETFFMKFPFVRTKETNWITLTYTYVHRNYYKTLITELRYQTSKVLILPDCKVKLCLG